MAAAAPGLERIVAITEKLRQRLPFLGFVLSRRGDGVRIRLRADNVLRMRRRMAEVRALYHAGAIDLDEVTGRVRAWLADARHGHSRALCAAELDRLRFTLAEPED